MRVTVQAGRVSMKLAQVKPAGSPPALDVQVEPLGIGVVGLGYWGPQLLRNLLMLPDVAVPLVCDGRELALEAVLRRNPTVEGVTELEALLDNESIAAVAVATPVKTHFDIARRCLLAGKHVFVEKPLASSSAEAEELIRLADERGLVLMPGHTFLYSPPVNIVGELIAQGELGEPLFVTTSRVNLGIHQSDVSVIWDLAPHDFSILHYWLGQIPSRVSALVRSCVVPTTADVAFVSLEFPSGTIAHVELAWLAPSKLRRTAVVGSKKMVVYDDTSNEPVRIFDKGVSLPDPGDFGQHQLAYRSGPIISPAVPIDEPLQLEMEDFCTAIRTGAKPKSSASLGLTVVRMMEAVDLSIADGGAPVSLPVDTDATVSAVIAPPNGLV